MKLEIIIQDDKDTVGFAHCEVPSEFLDRPELMNAYVEPTLLAAKAALKREQEKIANIVAGTITE